MEEPKIKEETVNLNPINLDNLQDNIIGEGFEKPDLSGEDFEIQKVELIPKDGFKATKDGQHKYRDVHFKVWYDEKNYESYGGTKQFVKDDQSFGEPTFDPDANNATSKLFRLWLAKTGQNAKEVSRKNFFQGLKGRKVRVKQVMVQYQGKDFKKNIIESFL